ncbi:hypothetical protein [Candidatus Chlorohelix sp.]|uniref:hypothetical protein n=1 Tax=Candidatus Chlorohelix sp. TaxID=3139201 RepID=UPI00303EEC56
MPATTENKPDRKHVPIPHEQWISIRRWPVILALLLTGGMFYVISDKLTIGPNWIPLVSVVALLVPLTVSRLRGHQHLTRILGLVITGVVTLALVASVVLLITSLLAKSIEAANLLRDAALIWSANVMTFAVWYWEIDRGGPAARHSHCDTRPDFLFPQMNMHNDGWDNWIPMFIDYIFLAFNHSAAFSPTDTAVLSAKAKILVMTQASISLVVLAVLASRAVNIL